MAREVLRGLGCRRGELGILLVDDREIEGLNREFLHREGPTDVIAFPMDGGFEGVPVLLGDVVISAETALRQAREMGISLDEEVARLLIHGILHIFGYDHERGGQEAVAMEEREEEMMRGLKEKGLV